MPECSCPFCKTVFQAPSSAFGETVRCPACHNEYMLRTAYLAHFDLPASIQLQFLEPGGAPFTRFGVPVIVQYGYELPPLLSDDRGQLLITKAMFLRAQREEIASDDRGDYTLNRFVRIRVPNRSQGQERANARASSGWHMSPYEKALYGYLAALTAAYVPSEDIAPFVILVDLLKRQEIVKLDAIDSLP